MQLHEVNGRLIVEILRKLDSIRDQVMTHREKLQPEEVQTLVMVNDELDDVLLNWKMAGPLGVLSFDEPDDLDLED
jgi:hypothetical protein